MSAGAQRPTCRSVLTVRTGVWDRCQIEATMAYANCHALSQGTDNRVRRMGVDCLAVTGEFAEWRFGRMSGGGIVEAAYEQIDHLERALASGRRDMR